MREKRRISYRGIALGLFVLLVLLPGIFLPPSHGLVAGKIVAMQTAHVLAIALFQYANDHEGDYPSGQSSTEVFQKLIAGGYLTNSGALYLPLHGKVKAREGQPLKPENICWDITSPVDSHSPDRLPLVFMTGYKVDYLAGGGAAPSPEAKFLFEHRSMWAKLWTSDEKWPGENPGIAVGYKDMSATFRNADSNGAVPHLIDEHVDLSGKKYAQLTPEGNLGP